MSEEVSAQVKYLRPDSAKIPIDIFRIEVAHFLTAVSKKLEREGITDTEFQALWATIKTTAPDEEEFCLASVAIGKDPYEMAESEADALIETADLLPNDLCMEFLSAIRSQFSLEKAKTIDKTMRKLAAKNTGKEFSQLIKNRILNSPILRSNKPWEEGYEAAKKFRSALKINPSKPIMYENLREMFGMEEAAGGLGQEYFDLNGSSDRIDVIISRNKRNHPSIALSKKFKGVDLGNREGNEKFVFCRAIFEYLSMPEKPSIVTCSHLSSQKRNRAFAAEFLAPSEAIALKIKGRKLISEEEVQNIANQFRVDYKTVEHQIINNHLANIKSQF